jgi:tetratricopeptide (TPR) repeat protein
LIKKCPRCKSEQLITDAGNCSVCGTSVSGSGQEESDQLDLIVREVPEDDREFVGGDKARNPDDTHDKGYSKPGTSRHKEAPIDDSSERHRAFSYDPIGFSEPTLPPEPDSTFEKDRSVGSVPTEKPAIVQPKGSSSSGGFKKLTPEEVKAIERNLYGKNVRLADKEKASIRSKINEIENQATEISTHHEKPAKHERPEKQAVLSETFAPAGSESTGAGRGRGVAYFYKNFIKLPGQEHLTKHDELLLNGKLYALHPKRIKPTYLYVGMGVMFGLVLLLVASWFVRDAADGNGQVAGVVLDNNDRPYLKGATVRFPDLGVTIKSNPQGLFSSDGVPVGSHRVEYLVDGRVIGSDHTTVVDNGIAMLTLRPSSMKAEQKKPIQLATKPQNAKPSSRTTNSRSSNYQPPQNEQIANNETKTETPPKQPAKPSPNEPGSIVLAANVDGAKLSLNGEVVGAGNLKYSPIKPGNYKYEITASGYKKKSGSISVSAGETKKLEVELEQASQEVKQATYGAEDYFQSGVNALKAQSYQKAITDFTAALKQSPSYPQAIYNRGLAYQQLKENTEAHDDFLKAAEIYRMKKEINWAVTAYNRALEVNGQSKAALMGRAELYLAKGEEIAALADFDAVVKMDRRNHLAYLGMGRARYQQGNYKLAVDHFKDARSVNKDDPEVYRWLMLGYMGINEFKELKKAYDKFQELASDSQKRELKTDKRFTAALEIIKRQ